MYTTKNYPSKKALKEDLAKGVKISIYSPGIGEAPRDGRTTLEGPHYPKPHKWYAEAVMKDGYIVSIK